MSAEPKQSMGDRLRAFARQRREALGEPVALSGPARQRLQDEVGRTFAPAPDRAQEAAPVNWFAAFWPRISFAGGLLALFAMAVIFWIPKKETAHAPLTPFAIPQEEMTALTAASAPAAAARELSLEEQQRLPLLAATDAPARKMQVATSAAAGANSQNSSAQVRSAPPLASPSATSPAPSEGAAGFGAAKRQPASSETRPPNTARTTTQTASLPAEPLPDLAAVFSNQLPAATILARKAGQNQTAPVQAAVLDQFELRRSGTIVRVIDQDHSVYEGVILEPRSRRASPAKRSAEPQPAPPPALGDSFSFRVSGSNQALGQVVTFTGQMQQGQGGNRTQAAGSPGEPLTIQGRVMIGGTPGPQINAVELPR